MARVFGKDRRATNGCRQGEDLTVLLRSVEELMDQQRDDSQDQADQTDGHQNAKFAIDQRLGSAVFS